MRKLTFQSFALGSGGMPRVGGGDMGDGKYLGSEGRGETFWVGDEAGLGNRSPFLLGCLTAHTECLSRTPPLGEVSVSVNPHRGGSAATQAEGGFRSRSLWSGPPSSHLPRGPGWVFLQSPESPSPGTCPLQPLVPWVEIPRFGSSASHYAWWLARLYSAGLSADH